MSATKLIHGKIIAQEEIKSSSSDNVYEVTLYDNCISCTCPAGGKKCLCKHMVKVLHDNIEILQKEYPIFYKKISEALEMKKQLETKQKNYFYKILVDKNTKKQELNEFYKVNKVPYFERKIKSGKSYNLPPILLEHYISSNNNYVKPLKQYGWYF